MITKLKTLVYNTLKRFGLALIFDQSYEILLSSQNKLNKLEILMAGISDHKSNTASELFTLEKQSKSQLGQDLFALVVNKFKRGGYFVEFGATDGINLSNTYILEKEFGWEGLLAEPAKVWHNDLIANRQVKISFDCVWEDSGKTLKFSQAQELSTISMFENQDIHAKRRKGAARYDVQTISLKELLDTHGAPQTIDFLSIDTEGSEYDILKAFDFSSYKFNCICVEHNFTSKRELLYELLLINGYKRVFMNLSSFDDWYVFDEKANSRFN